MKNLSNIAAFVQVAQASGFAAGAARLGISTSAASKAVTRVEEELGVKLFHRTTRSVTLTAEGERFLEGARRLLADAEALTAEITDTLDTPRGPLVISAAAAFGRVWLTEKVLAFMAAYPKVVVELKFEDRQIDLAAEGIDVAVRIGELNDSASIVARKLFDDRIETCASPAYLAEHGRPERLSDLEAHRVIHYRIANTGRFFPFMTLEGGEVQRRAFEPAFVANSVDALCQGAVNGVGIAQLPTFLAAPEFRSGRLERVFPAQNAAKMPYSIIYLERRLVSPRIRAFVDFLKAQPPILPDL
ncbi:MAG: LysR family transcriptional regulator [Pseudomonadota bacterium]